MGNVTRRAKRWAELLGTRQIPLGAAIAIGRHRLHSDWTSFGLRRDLRRPFSAPPAAIPLVIRPLREEDTAILFDVGDSALSPDERSVRENRRSMARQQIMTGYVAADDDGEPCFVQWLLDSRETERMRGFFADIFPRLASDEALLEGAYTPEAHRGKRIMPHGMAKVAELGEGLGARWVITFVTDDNVASLKGCKRAGFSPYLRREERWRWFQWTLTFTPLPEGTPYPFDETPSG
ncbi:MAG: GNAT family N-acetyltransferase [Thermomicrobiales bacterium]